MAEPGGPMKGKGSNKCSVLEEPVWCDHCRVRIAPYEETVTVGGKSFHKHCFSKAHKSSVTEVSSEIHDRFTNLRDTSTLIRKEKFMRAWSLTKRVAASLLFLFFASIGRPG